MTSKPVVITAPGKTDALMVLTKKIVINLFVALDIADATTVSAYKNETHAILTTDVMIKAILNSVDKSALVFHRFFATMEVVHTASFIAVRILC